MSNKIFFYIRDKSGYEFGGGYPCYPSHNSYLKLVKNNERPSNRGEFRRITADTHFIAMYIYNIVDKIFIYKINLEFTNNMKKNVCK